MDATKMRGLARNSFDAVLCEHMIEHVPKTVGIAICSEVYRILKPGGVARFVTPSIERLAKLIHAPEADELELVVLTSARMRCNLSPIDMVNSMFYGHGHRYIYGVDELKMGLAAAGFNSIVTTSASDFSNPIFKDAQGHSLVLGERMNNLEAFGLEAIK